MGLGEVIQYVLVTVNTDGEEVVLSDMFYDPSEIIAIRGSHKNETIMEVVGNEYTPYMKWNTDRYEWQLIN